MPLRIACDLDGTLADMDAALQREAERLFGPGIDLHATLRSRPEGPQAAEMPDPTSTAPGLRPVADARTGVRLSDRQQRQLWARVREIENFWADLQEVEPGCVARLGAAAAAHDWEVIFLTQRPACAGATTQIQTQRWLKAHGFELPSVYVVPGSRGPIAAALSVDAVLDDRPENCLDVATDSQAMSILVWRDAPHLVPPGTARLGIHVVQSIDEAVAMLVSHEASRTPGVVGRLRRTLGI